MTPHCLNLDSFHTRPRFVSVSRRIGDDDDDPFNLNPKHLRGSIKTKLALCLVSKSFNSLATEFLYECIHFNSRDGLNRAVPLFTRGGANKLWWTKVLEINFCYTRGRGKSVTPITHLLPKCANLRLLVFPKVSPELDLDQVETVYRSLPRSVRAIRWDTFDLPILQWLPTTVLNNIYQMSIKSVDLMSGPALTLPRLTYLHATDEFAPTNLTLPALRTVCLVAWGRDKELESSPLGLFIQSYAQQITRLQIETPFEVDFPVPLIDRCTNLATLKYDPFLVRIRNPPQSINRDAVQHMKLTHVHLLYNIKLVTPLTGAWEANYAWLLNGVFPALKHIIVLQSCVAGRVERQALAQIVRIVGAWTDPRATFECGVSACT